MPPVIYFAKSGKREAPTLPADAITRTFGIFGVKDSGKTTTGRVIAEGICRLGGNVVILDPVGVWWGITRAGEGPGFPGVVIGGEHADVPLEETGGHLVAEIAMARQWPVVVIDLKLLRKGAAQRFMADFLEEVYLRNRKPLHLIFEEADRALPQSPRGMNPTLGRVMGAAEDIVKLGRSRGLGSTFLSQRMATVTKNVVEQVEAMIWHAQVGANDQRAVLEWIKWNGDPAKTKVIMESLAGLDVGEAWLYSPKWLKLMERVRVKFPKTLDSSSTPTNDEREVEEAATRAVVDLGELRRLMAETVEQAEANDPKLLRERIAALERKLEERPAPEVVVPEPVRVLVPDPGLMTALSECVASMEAAQGDFEAQLGLARDAVRDAAEVAAQAVGPLGEWVPELRRVLEFAASLPPEGLPKKGPLWDPRDLPVPQPRDRDEYPPARAGDPPGAEVEYGEPLKDRRGVIMHPSRGDMSRGASKLLAQMQRLVPLRLTRLQLATILSRGAKSSTLTGELAELKDRGLIDGTDSSGYVVVNPENGHVSSVELRERFRLALPDGPRTLFEVVIRDHEEDGGDGLTRDELFTQAGFSATSSTPVTHLKLLKDNGLAEVAAGRVRLGSLVAGGGMR